MIKRTNSFERAELRALKNKAELPLYIVCALFNFSVILLVILSFAAHVGFGIAYYAAFAYLFVGFVFSLGSTFSSARRDAVQIGSEQFPEIYSIASRYAKILGLKKVPQIYIMQKGGMLNAFASYFFFRNYVIINSDVFDIAYLKHKDVDALSFLLAHEMAHIAFSHTKIWYNFGILTSKYVPILFPALSRAMEYSCDNVAKSICPEGLHGAFIMVAGKHLYKEINVEAYLKQARNTKGWFEFYGNLMSTHPIPVRRIPALYGVEKQKIF